MVQPIEMLRAVIQMTLYLAATYGTHPSSRIVYYLHTTPAAWASARDTCVREGGHLLNVKNNTLVMADIDTLDRVLEWKGDYGRLTTDVWSGLHRFTDPNKGEDIIMWHRCELFNGTLSNSMISTRLRISENYCASMDAQFALQPKSCDTKLPYICQVDEGQCWFLPFEGKSFTINISNITTGDLNTCAMTCRNDIKENNFECWGFVEKAGICNIYRDNGRHTFIRYDKQYLKDDPYVTSYVKICTGGETTKMPPVVEDNSVKPSHVNCTVDEASNGNWDNNVCYCDCDQPPIILDPEYLVLPMDEKIDRIVRELKVNSKETSATYRKLNSIEDGRRSAQSIGAVGIIILALVFGSLVLFDLDVVISFVWRVCCRKDGAATG